MRRTDRSQTAPVPDGFPDELRRVVVEIDPGLDGPGRRFEAFRAFREYSSAISRWILTSRPDLIGREAAIMRSLGTSLDVFYAVADDEQETQ